MSALACDLNSRLINLRDSLNNDTSCAYDNAGRVTMETNELSNTRSFWHDAAGNLTRKKDRNERVTQYTFDDLDRLTAEKWLTNENGDETVYAYDALNRLTSITGEDPDAGGGLSSPVTSFTYDAANNLLTQVDALSKTTIFDYDERNRLVEKTLPDPDGGSPLPAPSSTYSYDGAGNLVGEGKVYMFDAISHDYDPYGRLTNTTWGNIGGGGAHKEDNWTYDVLGRGCHHAGSKWSA